MALPKVKDILNLSAEEIAEQIVEVKRELFQLRFQLATRQLEKPHEFKHKKHRLAQLLTLERQVNPQLKTRKAKLREKAKAAKAEAAKAKAAS
ncbi:MAG: 50S ribosomal protein L29 [Synechococcales cyanobacterium RM1_1_8]|nr:50S ribosomal protein L29 [Synechococcales cyanobacterium RM1_1_8]